MRTLPTALLVAWATLLVLLGAAGTPRAFAQTPAPAATALPSKPAQGDPAETRDLAGSADPALNQ